MNTEETINETTAEETQMEEAQTVAPESRPAVPVSEEPGEHSPDPAEEIEDPDASNPHREAAKYRKRLREVEAERDQLKEQLQEQQLAMTKERIQQSYGFDSRKMEFVRGETPEELEESAQKLQDLLHPPSISGEVKSPLRVERPLTSQRETRRWQNLLDDPII